MFEYNKFWRITVTVLLVAAIVLVAGAGYALLSGFPKAGAVMNTASGILALNSLAQLKESGWFDRVMAIYSDSDKYPYGPPSSIVRTIVDDPERPIRTFFRNKLFLESRTGAYLAIASIVASIASGWM
ncbi:hypothetical protein [Rhizobium sp.]|uniref:hypothetical protein n=1 Tax=Rhizobium sp. TaxID=391 RepID=UPI003F81F90D